MGWLVCVCVWCLSVPVCVCVCEHILVGMHAFVNICRLKVNLRYSSLSAFILVFETGSIADMVLIACMLDWLAWEPGNLLVPLPQWWNCKPVTTQTFDMCSGD